MRLLVSIVLLTLPFVVGCSSGDQEETAQYQNGYTNGLEAQRAHICAVMEKHAAAFAALKTERICE
jgi:hypothetical protein